MAETDRETRRIKVNGFVLVIPVIIAALIIGAAVYCAPKFGKVFADYRSARAEYREALADLDKVQKVNDDLSYTVGETEKLMTESDKLMQKTFKLAAQLERDIKDGKSNKKICYITIDDGPYKRGQKFLELFRKYDVKATFFLTTANGDKLPDQADIKASSVYKDYLKNGHTIGNHTYSHNYSDGGVYSDTGSFMKSVEDQRKFTEEATGGYVPVIVRFPGGTGMAGNKLGAIEKALRKKGYCWVDWTVDSGDSWGKDKSSPKVIMDQIREAAKDQDIMVILCHEWSKDTQKALPEMIEYLSGEGYIFLPMFPESSAVMK